MRTIRQCLNCANFHFDPAPEWRPSYAGAQFDLHNLRNHLGDNPKWNSGWPGECYSNPAPVAKTSIEWCGQWQVNDDFLQTWWQLWGLRDAQTENSELRKELKAAQKLSLERYHKLRKMGGKAQ